MIEAAGREFPATPEGLRCAVLVAESAGSGKVSVNGRKESLEDAKLIIRQTERTIRKWIMKERSK